MIVTTERCVYRVEERSRGQFTISLVPPGGWIGACTLTRLVLKIGRELRFDYDGPDRKGARQLRDDERPQWIED